MKTVTFQDFTLISEADPTRSQIIINNTGDYPVRLFPQGHFTDDQVFPIIAPHTIWEASPLPAFIGDIYAHCSESTTIEVTELHNITSW
jgi:hypothetical protein